MAAFIAVKSLVVSRQSAAVERLFDAVGDILAALQEISRVGDSLISENDIKKSRLLVGDSFHRFLTAQSRAKIAMIALDLWSDYLDDLLAISNNFAVDILQADEFSVYAEEFAEEDKIDRSWVKELSWIPSHHEQIVLAQSTSFFSARSVLGLVSDRSLKNIDYWWGSKVLDDHRSDYGPTVYSIDSGYMTQHTRLLDDFVGEYLQPALTDEIKKMTKNTRWKRFKKKGFDDQS